MSSYSQIVSHCVIASLGSLHILAIIKNTTIIKVFADLFKLIFCILWLVLLLAKLCDSSIFNALRNILRVNLLIFLSSKGNNE